MHPFEVELLNPKIYSSSVLHIVPIKKLHYYLKQHYTFKIRTLPLKHVLIVKVEEMHSYLKHYHPYIVERHGKTLLPQYLSMYR